MEGVELGGPALEERELVQRILKRDAVAESQFYDLYRSQLQRIATFFLGYGDPDVEDVVQDTFISAFANLSKFEFRSTLFHWLRRICVFKSYDRIRRRSRMVVSLDEELDGAALHAAVEQDEEKAQENERQAILEIVKKERAALDPRCREILELRDVKEKTYGEMMRILKIPVGTVMSRLARCKETLKGRVLKTAKTKGIYHG